MKEIRLLQVVPALNSGGVEKGTIDIAKAISDLKNKSIVVSNGGKLAPLLKNYGSVHINLPVHSKNPFIMYNNIRKLRHVLFSEKINIMHTRSRAPAWSSYFAGNNNVKLVSTFHNVYGHENFLKKYYITGLAKADSIIAISKYVKDSIVKIYDIPEKKISIIHRGVDENYFDPQTITEQSLYQVIQKYDFIKDQKIILFPARLTAWKGQIEFLEVLKKIKNNNYICIFVGDDKNYSYMKKLNDQIIKKNLGQYCKVIGHSDDIKYIYQISHLVVNASQKPEGFCRVIAEAMSMEKVVIAYDQGGASELMAGFENKFKINYNDINQMAQAIDYALNMPKDEAINIGKKLRNTVKKSFTKNLMINKTLETYYKLLS